MKENGYRQVLLSHSTIKNKGRHDTLFLTIAIWRPFSNPPGGLTSFYKCGAAFRAADFNFPLPSGNADLLPAAGTFVNVIILCLIECIFLSAKEGADFVGFFEITLIFQGPLISVAGENPIVGEDQKRIDYDL